MKPPRFDYVRTASVEEAIDVLTEHGEDARVLAGGQSLVAMLNMRLLAPEVVVDISRVPELATITRTEDAVEIGAAVTQAATQRLEGLASHLPLVARALPVRRARPDPRPRHGMRLHRARGPELGAAAVPRRAGRRGRAALRARKPGSWRPRTFKEGCSPPHARRTK